MFFIGIFGIGNKEEEKKLNYDIENCLNPTIIKQYQMFHFFFIPIFKWNRKYFVKCDNSKLLELNDVVGTEVWNGIRNNVLYWDYKVVYEERKCSHCGALLNDEYDYCPKCGTKIK